MKFLHTSDWHIGRSLYGRKRYEEFAAFLTWLADVIAAEGIDALLVAGDIFDTGTPGNRAQELYYRFLCNVAASGCRHVVVIAGNHDSPSFLDAPKELLRSFNVHVLGSVADNPEDEVVVLKNMSGAPEAIVCAVPFLRDRDVRRAEAGESIEDKSRKLLEGVAGHYKRVGNIAREIQDGFCSGSNDSRVPIIGMGHLFTAGGKTVEGDGVRELYVGSLAHVGSEIFPACMDYVALGHLHVPQKVGGNNHIRYSGSPIPMGYGEARQQKKVVLAETTGKGLELSELSVPVFQELERVTGSMEEIIDRMDTLKANKSSAWLEIEYKGSEIAARLRETLEQALKGTGMEILRIKNTRIVERVMGRSSRDETLDDLDENDVFNRCLDAHQVDGGEREMLLQCYKEVVASLLEDDIMAE